MQIGTHITIYNKKLKGHIVSSFTTQNGSSLRCHTCMCCTCNREWKLMSHAFSVEEKRGFILAGPLKTLLSSSALHATRLAFTLNCGYRCRQYCTHVCICVTRERKLGLACDIASKVSQVAYLQCVIGVLVLVLLLSSWTIQAICSALHSTMSHHYMPCWRLLACVRHTIRLLILHYWDLALAIFVFIV